MNENRYDPGEVEALYREHYGNALSEGGAKLPVQADYGAYYRERYPLATAEDVWVTEETTGDVYVTVRVKEGARSVRTNQLHCQTCGEPVAEKKQRDRGYCENCRGQQVSTPGDWWEHGNCKEPDNAPPERIRAKQALFFRDQGNSVREAMAICKGCSAEVAQSYGLSDEAIPRCPVLAQCRDYAVRENIPHGVWGGTTEKDRRRLRAELRQKIQRQQAEQEYPAAVASAS